MGSKPESYVKEFTRHSTDMMLNLNEMRKREILTDVKVLVDGEEFKAHKAVLIACSGFFYSIFSDQTKRNVSLLTLPCGVTASGFRLLLEFMYTSCLPLDVRSVTEVLMAASYLQMDHVAETCRSFACFSVPQLHTYLKSLDYPLAYSRGSEDSGRPFIPSRALLPTRAPHLLVAGGPGYLSESAFRFPERRVALRGPRLDPVGEFGGRRCGSWAGGRPDPRCEARPPRGGKQPEERALAGRPETCGLGGDKPPVPSPGSPLCSDCHPGSPTESRSTSPADARCPAQEVPAPDPKACNWKKYKFIVLNSLSQQEAKGSCSPEPLYSRSGNPSQGGSNSSSSGDESSTNMEEETEDKDLTCKKPTNRLLSQSPASRSSSASSLCELHSELSHPGEEMPEYHSEYSDSGSENSLFSCSTCDLKLSDEDSLQQHFLRVHSDAKPYKCDMCQAAFRYKGNLASHQTVHTGEKPYRCTVCGAQFNRPANLKTHTRIHSGEKPYKCETCGARFVQVAHLRAHVLIHTGEKPYPCETCGTRFRHLQTLKSHIRIHTGEKPYHCEKCDLHFRHKSQLRLHLRQKHGAITNTKIRYKIVPELYGTGHQSC
ncbi:B-cell lymphoma 6 protein homolog isoform X1 [Hemiscyllium ocellatum]|uniref:B-cell lymphoma 6 protein homolog isoform X1 n=1 Tax=Hemiscyllium ocellatum TaxID=170820 RepID=UPI00296706A5|nr:B-cell lymphoma 6 protein homolog isoform X1 [Hemiscyllium ocellatum]XP_060710642.1 B-cell lymphoma 6 protein homolog isoform X1 [Hemiscyllium ocellatum]XP_060710643.1 B-cell lymphoma 6 protein homolog isoform X1 [Hemiscyllium ocellatum]XP_060710644.1 B-cell lymphoma 6 protein homolog isoform X1 [Hemiscyllium ocellatum]XP_060710645.1 B-cell lymphoma 6 protein homolog isoform X1 [Hemiscyllium ocellatum]